MSAFLGIQKADKHKQDFEAETPFPFILAGVIVVVGFILVLATIVKFVLAG